MRTTVEVPDKLYRQIKARAALRGQTIKAFFLDAVRDKLAKDNVPDQGEPGWMAVFGKAKKEDMEELQRIIDEEFSGIHPEEWA
jgi:hypothetical protein